MVSTISKVQGGCQEKNWRISKNNFLDKRQVCANIAVQLYEEFMSTSCLDCAKFKREIERLQAEVIRLGQQWLELKKFIISQEARHGNQESAQG